jgi:hypothetical protein
MMMICVEINVLFLFYNVVFVTVELQIDLNIESNSPHTYKCLALYQWSHFDVSFHYDNYGLRVSDRWHIHIGVDDN